MKTLKQIYQVVLVNNEYIKDRKSEFRFDGYFSYDCTLVSRAAYIPTTSTGFSGTRFYMILQWTQ